MFCRRVIQWHIGMLLSPNRIDNPLHHIVLADIKIVHTIGLGGFGRVEMVRASSTPVTTSIRFSSLLPALPVLAACGRLRNNKNKQTFGNFTGKNYWLKKSLQYYVTRFFFYFLPSLSPTARLPSRLHAVTNTLPILSVTTFEI